MPTDYLSRLRNGRTIPVFVAEGGWTSRRSDERSVIARFAGCLRQAYGELLEHANAIAFLQLNFSDIDVAGVPGPCGLRRDPFPVHKDRARR